MPFWYQKFQLLKKILFDLLCGLKKFFFLLESKSIILVFVLFRLSVGGGKKLAFNRIRQ